jgi:hypothetical protein
MAVILEGFSNHTAPPGYVTFTVLDQERSGHSVSIASKEFPGAVRATKAGLSKICAATVFEGAIEIIRRGVACTGGSCQHDDDSLLYAFISALLKHPHKLTRKRLMASISSSRRKIGGAHVILIMPPAGPSAWLIADPARSQ